ncbi:MAG: SPOR domain-containing protein [Bacteroidaceae bacterium]|nr:SPOR domain-containing protein [Bacteroidaceae bacterium]
MCRKYIKIVVVLFLSWLCVQPEAMSQVAVVDTSIVQYLERSNTGGVIQIEQPAELSRRVAREGDDVEQNMVKVPIYRIQLFSSNNPSAKAQAESLAKEVEMIFPEMPAMVSYVSPFWRLRVGEFRTYDEANAILPVIQKKFSDIQRGMLIIRERVSVPVHDYSND